MKEKTAMQIAIEEIKKERDSYGWSYQTHCMFNDVLEILETKLLPTERKQLEDAYKDGVERKHTRKAPSITVFINATDYVNQKYELC